MALPPRDQYADLKIFLLELKSYYDDSTCKPSFPSSVTIQTAVNALPPLKCLTLGGTSLQKGALINGLQKIQIHFGSTTWPSFFSDAARELA